ncbi:Helix-destabilizing protein,single-stranded DNA-binding protein,single-stranded DNA-binding protein,Single-strand binding protein family [Chlamydia poikilotherma]|uniref:Single-stranded DNA-binding protein n=1 Tax=Chlamydia poikilotherma TaxID=1967783 RepID=A0A3B0PNZ7_9CHLA|nr:single-stranded DNA-binding protein [Chlamydia poikilotherma]SYX08893.1 Helix-destabilizing protein,single-stranded DNA-binding protein,single-stranded DNA-binding protein,Single-strand binding protein family [Chlamydia poikilotherma]
MMFGYFVGYLGADPEERMTSKGKRVVVLRLGVKSRIGTKDETVWCKCNVWHNRYDKMLPYLKKGSGVIIAGDISVESYMSKDGTPQSSLVISVDTIKFSPFSRSESRSQSAEDSSVQTSYENVSVGFEGESLDAEAVADKDMYAGYGQGQQYVSEDVPF